VSVQVPVLNSAKAAVTGMRVLCPAAAYSSEAGVTHAPLRMNYRYAVMIIELELNVLHHVVHK
jgi:hypothetical protein